MGLSPEAVTSLASWSTVVAMLWAALIGAPLVPLLWNWFSGWWNREKRAQEQEAKRRRIRERVNREKAVVRLLQEAAGRDKARVKREKAVFRLLRESAARDRAMAKRDKARVRRERVREQAREKVEGKRQNAIISLLQDAAGREDIIIKLLKEAAERELGRDSKMAEWEKAKAERETEVRDAVHYIKSAAQNYTESSPSS